MPLATAGEGDTLAIGPTPNAGLPVEAPERPRPDPPDERPPTDDWDPEDEWDEDDGPVEGGLEPPEVPDGPDMARPVPPDGGRLFRGSRGSTPCPHVRHRAAIVVSARSRQSTTHRHHRSARDPDPGHAPACRPGDDRTIARLRATIPCDDDPSRSTSDARSTATPIDRS